MATKKKSRVKRRSNDLPGEVVGEINGFPIRRVQAGVLTGVDYNPRTISDNALRGLGNSTSRFGLVQPIVWNKMSRQVVGGHQRLRTLDPDVFTDVVEVDLDPHHERALNLALNSPHIAGEFTMGLRDILADLHVEVPDLAQDLRLGELRVDIPADVDDLLATGDTDDKDTGGPTSAPAGNGGNWDAGDLRQIILILTTDEHDEAIDGLDVVMKAEGCESQTAAVLWLLRNYR